MSDKHEYGLAYLVDADQMDLEDTLAYMILSTMSLERVAPQPWAQALNDVGNAIGKVIQELHDRGVIDGKEVNKRTKKLVEEVTACPKEGSPEVKTILDEMKTQDKETKRQVQSN